MYLTPKSYQDSRGLCQQIQSSDTEFWQLSLTGLWVGLGPAWAWGSHGPLPVRPGPSPWFNHLLPCVVALWSWPDLTFNTISAHRQSENLFKACASHSQRRGKGWGEQKLPAAQSAEEHLWKHNVFEVSWVSEIEPGGFASACQASVPLWEGSG